MIRTASGKERGQNTKSKITMRAWHVGLQKLRFFYAMIDEDNNKRYDATKVQFSWTLWDHLTMLTVIKFHPDGFLIYLFLNATLLTQLLLFSYSRSISVNQLNASLDKLFFVCLFVWTNKILLMNTNSTISLSCIYTKFLLWQWNSQKSNQTILHSSCFSVWHETTFKLLLKAK